VFPALPDDKRLLDLPRDELRERRRSERRDVHGLLAVRREARAGSAVEGDGAITLDTRRLAVDIDEGERVLVELWKAARSVSPPTVSRKSPQSRSPY